MAVRWQDNSLLTYEQWLVERNKSIGASEVSVIVFGSKYSSNLEMYYEKIGFPKRSISNLRTWLGKNTEELSAQMWQHYDGKNDQSIVENQIKGIFIKKCENLNATAFNDTYPHLSATPDRKILPYGKYAGRGFGSLEIKNTQSWILNSYESKLPTENVIQSVTQLMVTTWGYGELFYFIDNRTVASYDFDRNDTKSTEEIILRHTTDFWDRVTKGRKLYNQLFEAERNFNKKLSAELQKEIEALEPPPQNTAAYLDYLSQRYKDRLAGAGVLKGTPDQLLIARRHKELDGHIKIIQKEKDAIEIELKRAIKEHNTLDFGKDGKVTWMGDKNNSRKFLNKVK